MVGVRGAVRPGVRIPDGGLKVRPAAVDVLDMLVLVAILTVGYFAAVGWLRRDASQRAVAARPTLPAADLPPGTAVGWPPLGSAFPEYVDEGFAALDAYLSQGFTA